MTRLIQGLAGALILWPSPLQGANDPADLLTLKRAVIATYAAIAHAGYEDALAGARVLSARVNEFVAAPAADGLAQARQAWIAARVPYAQTEVFRFYDGPIDALDGFINSWPIDENLIDYVEGEPDAGIVNQPARYPAIDADLLASLNERNGEKNITTGFHAIEFLLWGQDLSADGPGKRSYLDFVNGKHAARRREYLTVATHLLEQQLGELVRTWSPEEGANYRTRFLDLPPDEAITLMLKGLGILSGAELAGERLTVAYESKEQEDEHSCFSDNTHEDLRLNAQGLQNVFRGRYGRVDGPGIDDLLERRDPALATRLGREIDGSLAAAAAIPSPFDQAIRGRDSAPGRIAVKHAITAFRAVADSIAASGASLGLRVVL